MTSHTPRNPTPAPANLPPEPAKSAEEKLADLRRMRILATSLLGAMAAVFLATSASRAPWPWIPYLRAFAEAGMVGACADWFAVVALFRRPFGLPIPHTAVVPANKQRIGVALGRFITNNFLSTRVASERLARVDALLMFARWIGDHENSERLAGWVSRLLPKAVAEIPEERLSQFVGEAARRGVAAIPAAPLASRALSILWAQGAAQELLEQGLEAAEAALTRNRAFIARKVSEQSSRWAPKWIDNYITDKVLNGLLQTMREMREPSHPWRAEAQRLVDGLIRDLAADPDLFARGEAIKADLIANPVFLEQARSLWSEIEATLRAQLSEDGGAAGLVASALREFGRWMGEDPRRRTRLNRQLRLLALRALLPRRAEIGAYIAHVVDAWDTATLVHRLELQVGKDLQYIRINGTLVGGLVGLLIFALSRAIGGP
jgi:uncharacterized membrane-anchored protein YjiN (DUF445 family)